MTSECYVYVTLPGRTDAVVAGRFRVVTARDGTQSGQFVYGRSYLDRPDRVAIDPVRLAVLDDRVKDYAGPSPVFPALRDASPDRWGRLVIERERGGELDELGYLLDSPDDRAGALGFGLGPVPPAPLRAFNRTLGLPELLDAADALLSGQPAGEDAVARQVERLQLLGTSMGGARPKTVVEDEEGLWLAKFGRRDDDWDNPRVEHAMLGLAAECGLSPARSKVVTVAGRPVLFVKRFDRERTEGGYLRHRMISALTFLDAGESSADRSRWSYPLLAEGLQRHDADHLGSRRELFRRMAFNALISNVDDHPRNHALVADAGGWRLSPAYDLVPTPMVSQSGRTLAMRVGAAGRAATRDNLLTESPRFGYPRDEAASVVDDMREIVVGRWYAACRAAGVTPGDCERIRGAFAYPGFDWSVEAGGDGPPSP